MKETDLTRVHPGQSVEVSIDTYPDCTWHGVVESVAPASGAAFSPLPAQNISGNWVKVVQRIPVRITFDQGGCDARLSVGMSAVITIDTGYSRWKALGIG
jgi:membrane fusion protein (multidrug efflux system)